MPVRKPYVRVAGPVSQDLVPAWGDKLLGLTISDFEGYESDECVLRFADTAPYRLPPKGTRYRVSVGWDPAALTLTGHYEVQRIGLGSDPESGSEMHVICRACDFLDTMKEVDDRHFDRETGHDTVGKIVRQIASDAGVEAVVDPELDAIPIDYRLMWKQSRIDFLTDLADDIGGIIKPQAGRLVVRKRGAGRSASGADLPMVEIPHDPLYGFDLDLEPRPDMAKVDAPWFDSQKGIIQSERRETGRGAGRAGLPHPFPNREEAELGARSAAQQQGRTTGNGSFEMAGNPAAVGGAPARTSGFGTEIDAIDWTVSAAIHEIDFEGTGWLTTVETEVKETA